MAKTFTPTYYHATADGRTNQHGRLFEKVPASAVPDGQNVAVLGMHEDKANKGDWDRYRRHWAQFHAAIDLGLFVRLVHDGPLDYELYADKDAAEAKYGKQDADGAKNAPRDRRITTINLAQFLNPDYWDWSDAEKQTIIDRDLPGMLKVIAERVKGAGFELEFLYGIFHNMDTRVVWDYGEKAEVDQLKEEHIHAYGKVKGKHGAPLEAFAQAIGLEAEFLLYPKKGRDAVDNCLAYLIHAKDEEKHLYQPQDVVTHVGESYLDIYARRKRSWDIGRAIKAKSKTQHDLPWLLDKIRSGQVRSRNAIRLNDDMERIYKRHPEACDKALHYIRDLHMREEMDAFEAGEYSMTVVFVTGKPGRGKSRFCGGLVNYFEKVRGWTMAKAASTHGTEGLLGEEIFYDDDSEENAMTPREWKNLLDPYEANPAAERFHNKDAFQPRLLLISSEYGPESFFAKAASKAGMDIGQFIRRSGINIEVLDYEDNDGYSCRIKRPVEVPAYDLVTYRLEEHTERFKRGSEVEITHEQIKATYIFHDVGYRLAAPKDAMEAGEELAFTLWAAAEYVARAIDKNNSDWMASRPDSDALFALAQQCVVDRLAPSSIEVPDDWKTIPPALPESKLPSRLALEAPMPAQNVQVLPESTLPAIDYAAIRKTPEYIEAVGAYNAAAKRFSEEADAFSDKVRRLRSTERFEKSKLLITDNMRLEAERLRREVGECKGCRDDPCFYANWPKAPMPDDYLTGDLLMAYQDSHGQEGISIDSLFPND